MKDIIIKYFLTDFPKHINFFIKSFNYIEKQTSSS